MPTKITKNRINEFIRALEKAGGSSGNGALRRALDWDEEFYWRVQGHLIELGQISAGRGKGGSVRFTDSETEETAMGGSDAPDIDGAPCGALTERDLYVPLRRTIEGKWIRRFALDNVLVDETHSRGSKDTGGTFTRPDITAAGIRRYVYLPKRLEIVTFEVKATNAVNIMGVLEAIAHREAAHRAYVLYATPRAEFEAGSEAERIIELAQKYGVGVVLTEAPDQVETWEILVDAIRHEPDPGRLDRFLGDLPNEEMKKELSKWKE